MLGPGGTGDTSGYGGLRVRKQPPLFSSEPPYGSYFDEVADALAGVLQQSGAGFGDAIERVVADHDELTFTSAASTWSRWPAAAGRSRARVRVVRRGLRHALPGPTLAASCTPSTICSRSPTTGGCGSR